jgi:hypothetical protein
MTRRGLFATLAAAVVGKAAPKPQVPTVQEWNEMYDRAMYGCFPPGSVVFGHARNLGPSVVYWHGKCPFVRLDLHDPPWKKIE